jgi:LacI family transcriptional regulator
VISERGPPQNMGRQNWIGRELLRTSLRQVAERAGVSGATVSRVLNDVNVCITPETRARVKGIAAEMGYHPNRVARALATGRTQALALWIVNFRSPYYTKLMYHNRQQAELNGYDLMISGAKVRSYGSLDATKLLSWPVDGIIAVDVPRGDTPGLENSLFWGKPIVNMGGYVSVLVDYVCLDFRNRSREAVIHLHNVGCRRIAYVVPDWFEWFNETNDPRLRGYQDAMDGLGLEPEYIITSNEWRSTATATVTEYYKDGKQPDGLFCFNDDMAIGAYRAVRDLGLNVPSDVALIGCDGIEETEYLDPQLTTLEQPVAKMCELAWQFMKQRIEDPTIPIQSGVIEPNFLIRGSSQR